jgi:hypothetical protein
VVRALLGRGIAAFAVLQVHEPVMHGLHLPEWTLSFVVVVLGLGFPVTAALAWVFDLEATGIVCYLIARSTWRRRARPTRAAGSGRATTSASERGPSTGTAPGRLADG